MVEQLQETSTVEIDGNIYDAETGEFLQSAGRKSDWLPQDAADYEWLGEKLGQADAEILAIEARRKFVNENFDAMVKDVQRKKDGLLWKFGRMIEDFARGNLPKGKKTWTCPTMSVSFRLSGPRLSVTDPDLALSWARDNAPEAVVVKESFQVSKLPQDAKESLMQSPVGGFEVVPEKETASIKTSS